VSHQRIGFALTLLLRDVCGTSLTSLTLREIAHLTSSWSNRSYGEQNHKFSFLFRKVKIYYSLYPSAGVSGKTKIGSEGVFFDY
jgi:hypothetical protein